MLSFHVFLCLRVLRRNSKRILLLRKINHALQLLYHFFCQNMCIVFLTAFLSRFLNVTCYLIKLVCNFISLGRTYFSELVSRLFYHQSVIIAYISVSSEDGVGTICLPILSNIQSYLMFKCYSL